MAAESYIPKEATQQNEFLKRYPEYDGRGIKIAVIDSDIADISLPGMKKTSTGLPKIIDCLGKVKFFVDTSTIVETQFVGENKFITGLSGRKLNIPSTWKNISEEWHIGSIQFELLHYVDEELENKIKKDVGTNKFTSLKDVVIDCIVWSDGEKWCACVDTTILTNESNIENIKVLTNFDEKYEYAYLLNNSSVYCVNIFDDGNSFYLLQPPHDHATIVCQIAAGYIPEKPASSGLAPGSQICSMHNEDLEKALLKCIELEVDIVNFSYHPKLSNCIAVKKIIEKMVVEYGIIIIQGAGNDGPFYSSIPSQYNDQLKLNTKFHSVENVNTIENFSSKGPLPCGARGIDFVAPGSAIVDLPKWYSKRNRACYGTSFAVPQIAGSVACLLSALKANNIPYSPSTIKFALANTAFLPKGANKLEYGNGLIQINDAFEFFKQKSNILSFKYLVPILTDDPEKKGILYYQRENELSKTYRYFIKTDSPLNTNWTLKYTLTGEKFISCSKTDKFFTVKIDTSSLEKGSINYAEIYCIDSSSPLSPGPMFYLPVTVIYPADSFINKTVCLKPGPPTHFFFRCPSESRLCHITITALEKEKTEKKIILGYNQKKSISNKSSMQYSLKFKRDRKTRSLSFMVEDDVQNFELCFYHTHLSSLNFMFDINFRNVNI